MSLLLQRIARYIAWALLGVLIASVVVFYLVTHPREITSERTPADLNLPAESVELTTSDGVSIAGWHIPSPDAPESVLLLLHGYPANKADLLSLAAELYPEFSILLIDFRSFGESGGSATTLGIHEGKDVDTALSFLEERYENIGVFGYSYGGSVALQRAASDDRIDAVASYAAFSDLRTLAQETYSFLWILKYPFVELMNLYARIWFGEWASVVSPAAHAPDISEPVFLGHTEADPMIDDAHAHALAEALHSGDNEPTLFISSGNSHMGLPPTLPGRLQEFFNKHLE